MTKAPPKRGLAGVDNAARTRDLLNHNQLLYRLSYIHHVCVIRSPGFAQQMDTIQDFPDNANSARRTAPVRWETGSITQPHTPKTHTINQDMCCFVRCNRMQ